MLDELSKWPLIYQLLAGIGAAGMGALMYWKSRNAAPVEPSPFLTEMQNLRKDLGITIESLKTSMNDQLGAMRKEIGLRLDNQDERLRDVETTSAILKDRQDRPRSR